MFHYTQQKESGNKKQGTLLRNMLIASCLLFTVATGRSE